MSAAEMKIMQLTSVSSGYAISPFRLNLTVQTLVGSFPGVIVPIPLHTPNINQHSASLHVD
jgi:hypothetical protein